MTRTQPRLPDGSVPETEVAHNVEADVVPRNTSPHGV